ncbi:hypothetical protein Y032_0048g1721 [Ancylostoma ceylanicum]|uniref:Uncharacterized protein n=1 Tax=Ancylostoma ceylanicum TaxID=53326 RepID=A0A016UBU0_9BILA|nr:hypothetical protein Y032_0048g1721 [Ancylostoma ceylanicum]
MTKTLSFVGSKYPLLGSEADPLQAVLVIHVFARKFVPCKLFARQLIRKRSNVEKPGEGTEYGFEVSSTTNFPVGAGLASSAAGFAAIAVAIGKLFDLSATEVSTLARMGSGSACRSVFGGLVEWCAGSDPSGADCVARQVLPEKWWPELRAVIVVIDDGEKEVGSSKGMRNTVETSELLKHRAKCIVPERIKRLSAAFEAHDFHEFALITMADSNQLHAICLDTFPPLKLPSNVMNNYQENPDSPPERRSYREWN